MSDQCTCLNNFASSLFEACGGAVSKDEIWKSQFDFEKRDLILFFAIQDA